MANAQPDRWVGQNSVVLVFRYDGNDVWHQGEFAKGDTAGVDTNYAFSNMIANNRKIWRAIPDDVQWLLFLPHPAKDAIVKITKGEHAGEDGRIVDTHPPSAHVTVLINDQTVSVPAADVEFLRK